MKPERDLAHMVGDARKRFTELQERAARRRDTFGDTVQDGPATGGEVRDLQWNSETWRNANAELPSHDEVHAHEDVDWNLVRGED